MQFRDLTLRKYMQFHPIIWKSFWVAHKKFGVPVLKQSSNNKNYNNDLMKVWKWFENKSSVTVAFFVWSKISLLQIVLIVFLINNKEYLMK